MSADLFAEFGFGSSTNLDLTTSRQQTVTSQTGSLIPDLNPFEHATPSQSSSRLIGPTLPSGGSSKTANGPSHTSDFEDYGDFGDFEQAQTGDGNNVLFDATLDRPSDDDSEDWGEFESAELSVGQNASKAPVERRTPLGGSMSLGSQGPKSPKKPPGDLDLLDSIDSFSTPAKPIARNNVFANTLLDDETSRSTRTSQPPTSNLPAQEDDFEEWADFTDGPMEASQISSLPDAKVLEVSNKKRDPMQAMKTDAKPEGRTSPSSTPVTQPSPAGNVRPTNIPPPSILLELFLQLFEQLRQNGAEAKKNARRKDHLDSVALSIFYTLKAAARVVAGRTLRWKRDAILSQSMRIGPARSGKAGGMKLSTVNKNEDIKEKQEAVDVINMWRDRAALFNSIIQASGKRPVQVIQENARVMTATAAQGAIKASHACALCGLKRDERIPKIDEQVEDSFGEWWTEHWGHTECRQFWEDNKSLLSQR
ncbi:hypothetical protein BJX61DRAFT_266683 [Aspergillus egyptiacus]|nr:hypothetical protein BJX61DRAFT_266683 [Aspergillus egyptiacus]